MKFNVDSYHFKLLRDYERLSAFKEAIDQFAMEYSNSDDSKAIKENESSKTSLAYDLGCGSGVLSYFASDYFDKVISIEMSPSTFRLAKENLKDFSNIEVFNENSLDFDFSNYPKADLIICEMLDTALIDEEEVPVLNHAKQYLKNSGKIIPQGIINQAEPVFMDLDYIQYEDEEYQPKYDVLGKSVIFSEFDFLDDIDESFSAIIEFEIATSDYDKSNGKTKIINDRQDKIRVNGIHDKQDKIRVNGISDKQDKIRVNGIKLTSFTKLNDEIICGPTPMLNPAMLVPFEETEVKNGEKIRIRLSYIMGGGVETIKTEVLD